MLLYRAEYRFDLRGTKPVKLPIIFEQSPIIIEVKCDRRKPTWNVAGTISQVVVVPAVGFVKLGNTFSVGFDKQELQINSQKSWLVFTPVPWLNLKTLITVYRTMATYPLSGNPIPVSSGGKNTLVSVLATATALVAADVSRLSMTLQNLGTKTVYVGFTNAVSLTSYAIAISANTAYEFPTTFTGALWAISASGTNSVNVVEMSI